MLEQELKRALQDTKPELPVDFDARSDEQIARLILEENNMKKKTPVVVLAIALTLVLGIGTAFATGLLEWNRGLKDKLQISDSRQEALEQTDLVDFPKQSVTQNGVTVTLDQCVADQDTAYIALRVSGYIPQKGMQPAFDKVDYANQGLSGNSSFYNGLIVGPDGNRVYASNGQPYKDGDALPYADKNGDLAYLIRVNADEGSLIGRKIKITLKNLGTYQTSGDVKVDVKGSWAFEWTINGTDKGIEWKDINAPIGDTGATLHSVRLSPVHISMELSVPRDPAAVKEGNVLAPYLTGIKMKDGTVYRSVTGGGSEGYTSATGDTYSQSWALKSIITPSDIDSLLFTNPREEKAEKDKQVFEIKLVQK